VLRLQVRSRQWRFIERADGSHELYAHQLQPNGQDHALEYHSVADSPEHAGVVREMHAMLVRTFKTQTAKAICCRG
jgi:hypothetical protein